jgi:hypothetical protein
VLTPTEQEQLVNLRRIAERGLLLAQAEAHSRFVDVFQHLLDELGRIK